MPSKFIRLHILTTYGPNNLNRDDTSRPKTAVIGGTPRLRLSSQCVKRAWRVSDVMEKLSTGKRTRQLWVDLANEALADEPTAPFVKVEGLSFEKLLEHIAPLREATDGFKAKEKSETPAEPGSAEAEGEDSAAAGKSSSAGKRGGKGKDKDKDSPKQPADLQGKALFFYSGTEIEYLRNALADSLNPAGSTQGQPLSVTQVAQALPKLAMSPDVALYGRMVASNKAMDVQGAVQVGHLFTVHKALVEDDFFVAVDDLSSIEEAGTAHLDANGFGSGTYYGYVCLDVNLLLKNLGGNVELAKQTVAALVEAVTTVSPSAKQNSFACHSMADFAMVEVGDANPVSLANAFDESVKGDQRAQAAAQALLNRVARNDACYPSQAVKRQTLNTHTGEGSLASLVEHALTAFGN